MKKTFLLLAFLIIILNFVKGQNPFISCIINFEDNPCWEASYYNVNIPSSNNVWQVYIPQKTIFTSAYSSPKAILTDSSGPYPVNNTSSFIIKLVMPAYCECAPVIGAYYKLDSDTLKDFGQIEFSLDHGTTWLNALSDTVIPDPYWLTPRPVLTGRIYHWKEFTAFIPGYYSTDTLYYRFTFISDSIQTNQDGWMLDDIQLVDHTEGIKDMGSRNEINIYPNPASGIITVSGNHFMGEMDVSVYDILGQLSLQQTIYKNKEDINISSLGKGIYMIRVLSQNDYHVRMIIKD
ncbi:MAG: T9SS type A sorting domain-containing protein [Bacteroidetes bacterium]|nr:T9SS type A sorting domain-containing protein [Bacteroidota bacterium]